MSICMIVAVSLATAAITLPVAAIAHADPNYRFQSPSGNIACGMGIASQGPIAGKSSAGCDIGDYSWAPPPSNCGSGGVLDHFLLNQGQPPEMICDVPGKKELGPGLEILGYGQTRSAGPITCDSELSGMTCTDTSTGHFFRLSSESYQLG
jgi:hypothetical protein